MTSRVVGGASDWGWSSRGKRANLAVGITTEDPWGSDNHGALLECRLAMESVPVNWIKMQWEA